MGVFSGPDVSESGLVLALDAANPKNFNLTEVEVLVVAGGGGGGTGGGGGGAGGLIYNRNFSVTPGSAVTVTIGGGGTGNSGWGSAGGGGGNSVFGSLTAIGGGAGLHRASAANSGTGGSGGGDAGGSGYTLSNATAGQGFSGGNSPENGTTDEEPGGGGGGAGGPGENASTPTASDNATVRATAAGAGGPGLGFDISGTFTYYAGGGGGSNRNGVGRPGGIGGGGTGGASPTAGSPNTGGGGGGTGHSGYGGGGTSAAGGSGIVIVRYPGPQKAIGGTVTSVAGHTIHTFTTSSTFTPLVATNNSAILGLSDFSGNNNFGTTVNSPVYSSANGGSIVFDGTDDYVTTTLGTYTPYCIDIWFYNDDSITSATMQGNFQQLLGVGSSPGGIALGNWTSAATDETFSFFSAGWTTNGMTYIRDTASPGIHNLVVNWSGSSFDFWLDGTKRIAYPSTQGHRILETVTGFQIGSAYNNVNSYEFDGNVYSVKVYTSQLSDSQVQQNFNATRARFGI